MSYTTIPSSVIEAGDPVTQELFGLVKSDLDDLNTRTTALEGGSNVAYEPYFWEVSGPYEQSVPLEAAGIIRLNFAITVLAGRVLIKKAGTGGTTEIDLLYKRGANPFVSIFTTKPSVAFGAGDYGISTNGVLNSPVDLLAGDIIRMDITTTQSGEPMGLLGILEYEKS